MLPRARRRLLVCVAVLLAAAAAGVGIRHGRPSAGALRIGAWRGTRQIEARVSGAAWAPFKAPEAARPQEASATRGDALFEQQQRRGVLELLAGDPRQAIAALEKASAANEPAVWSDLGAAYYETALRRDAPELLANALTATDQALALDTERAEALFNRALILERLGFRTDARVAWSRYLTSDDGSGWAAEARTHREALAPDRPFADVLAAEYDRIASDLAAAAAFDARDPFAARGQCLIEVLGRWAHAVQRHDERDAARHLAVARQLGHVIARRGDATIERAVAGIDGATGERRALLANAHAEFQEAMQVGQELRLTKAEPMLRHAAAAFRQAGSPAAVPAALWAANCLYEHGRRQEAEAQIEELLANTPAELAAYRAFMIWQLANARNARGEWGAAIERFEESAALFEKIGETGNVANVRRILAGIYDRIGDPESAWRNRLASLDGQGIRSNEVEERAVWSVIEAAIMRRDWRAASSFLKLYVPVVRRLRNDIELANALLLRAVVRDRLGDDAGVREDMAEARRVTSLVDDAPYREMLRASDEESTAMLRSTPAAAADALLTRAIEYETATNHLRAVPRLLWLRARARRRMENVSGARDDVMRGIEELEKRRESLPAGEARWGAFHSAEELFDEGIDLAMSAGDAEGAFRIAEQARGRALLESYGAPARLALRDLPPRTVVIEYAALDASLIIFAVDSSGVHGVRVEIARDAVGDEIATFTRALRSGEPEQAKRAGAALYARLIEPVASRIAGAETLVFVPDAVTSTLPFGALADPRGAYLIQQHAIVFAPSASAFAVADARRRRTGAPRSALLVSASGAVGEGGALRFVEREADRIARSYRAAFRIFENGSQFDELTERAPNADVIHFGGHAVGDPRGYEPASIMLRKGDVAVRVGVAEIAKLRLERTSVVVLAGCGTARGERRAAEGVISVAHGFLCAGVPSAVATLWPIADEDAAIFFPRLHQKLAAGMPPAAALRATQLECIQRGDVPPSLWAAVQDIGS